MSNLINMTINLEGWSNKRVIALLEWIDATDDSDGYVTPETFEGQKEVSAEIHEDLIKVKEEIDEINKVTAVQNKTAKQTVDSNTDEVLETLIKVIVEVNRDSFVKFFRRFVSKTQAELTDETGTHDAANSLTDTLKEAKGGANLAKIDDEMMAKIVRVLLTTRRDAGLTMLLEEDMEYLTAVVESLETAQAKLREAA